MPTINELMIKTGRDRRGVMEVLAVLAQERYIIWTPENPDRIELLEAWERKPTLPRYWHTLFGNKMSP
ncbi:hypothetical protein [Paenibacillus naphthalenovorans]|uniref:hypothetical protein n=1 Tax=Paenibacillus naphthalenovorans TaxID=162209 RepID=UPI003D2CDBC2